MATILVFPDHGSFEAGHDALEACAIPCEILQTPDFCRGLIAPALIIVGNVRTAIEGILHRRIPVSGVLPYYPFKKGIPEAPPPDPRWSEIIGSLRVEAVKPSITDPMRLRAEILPAKPLGALIPIMARLVKGGAYSPKVPVLALEEGHRLICFSPASIAILRADDLLDIWILVRTTADFICTAWHRRLSVKPETHPRQGIGATEIYRHLPATDCGACGAMTCMEFATGLLTGRSRVEWCRPLNEETGSEKREALFWLLRAIGLELG